MEDRRLEEALRHLEPPPGVKLWHGGPSVAGCLRGVSAKVASWKPYPDRLSIWGLALHIAYWNYAVTRRITDSKKGGFERSPSNFPSVPTRPSEEEWKADRKLVAQTHQQLVEAVAAFDATRLDEAAGDNTTTTYADLITGIVLHDVYHVGQIQLMKRLAKSAGVH